MSLKFSATTHSFRIGGWTNSDGNTALSSWNVFFFRKEIQWFEIKSKRASATADRWNNCRLLDEVFLFKFFLLFLFCFEREHDSSTCHDPIESSRADRAGRRDRENVHAPLVCFGFLFFFAVLFRVCYGGFQPVLRATPEVARTGPLRPARNGKTPFDRWWTRIRFFFRNVRTLFDRDACFLYEWTFVREVRFNRPFGGRLTTFQTNKTH